MRYILNHAHMQHYSFVTLHGAVTLSKMHTCSIAFASPYMALIHSQPCHMQRHLYAPLHGADTFSTMHTCSVSSVHDNTTHTVIPPFDDSRVVQLKYHSMNKEKMNAIAEAQNKGDMDLLYKHPRLKSIAGQGVITIKLNSVDRLVHPAWWRGGHKHV